MIIVIPLFWFLLICHRIILYRIQDRICGPPGGFYAYYDNYFQVAFSSFSPSIVMSILAYLLIKSVRDVVRRQIVPISDKPKIAVPNKSMIHQIDTKLTFMLILESFIAIVTYIPYALQLTYSNITQNWYKSPLRLAWESVFTELIHLCSYIFFASSFYVLISSNVGVRRMFKRLLTRKRHNDSRDHTATVLRTRAVVICEPNYK